MAVKLRKWYKCSRSKKKRVKEERYMAKASLWGELEARDGGKLFNRGNVDIGEKCRQQCREQCRYDWKNSSNRNSGGEQ